MGTPIFCSIIIVLLYFFINNKIRFSKLTEIKKAEVLYRKEKYEKAKNILIPLAENNNIEAQFLLGSIYYKEDSREATRWLGLAAESGHVDALDCILELYINKEMVTADDYEQAIKYLKLDSKNIYPRGKDKLGEFYFKYGQFHEKHEDIEQAIKCWKLASENDYAEAQFRFGKLFFDGKLVKQDYKQAIKYWELAAENKYAEAQFRLGKLFLDGKNVKQDYELAMEYLELALENQHPQAHHALEIVKTEIRKQSEKGRQEIGKSKNDERAMNRIEGYTPDKRGEKMHELCAVLMQHKNLNANEISKYQLSPEDIEKCKNAVNKVEKIINFKSVDKKYIEYDMKGKDLKANGKPDIFVIQGKKAILLDYKTGRGKVKPPKINKQLAAYAVLIMENFNCIESVKGFIIDIDKPNLLQSEPHIFKYENKNKIVYRLNNIISNEMGKSIINVTEFPDTLAKEALLF